MTDDDNILIGKIMGTHGLDGKMRADYYSESLDLFEKGIKLQLRGSRKADGFYTVKSTKHYKRGMLLRFEEIDHIDSAEPLVGSDLYISKENLPEPAEGEYYWFDIIGLSVYSIEGSFLGTVRSIFPTGSNDVYVIENNGHEILMPALVSIIRDIDLEARTMKVDLPDGL